jgi:hypothetical protein
LAPKPKRFLGFDIVPETSPPERSFAADMEPIDLVFKVLQAALQSELILWELEDPTLQPAQPTRL